MATRILIDGAVAAHVSTLDRGLAYGDGLFETVRFVGRHAPLWPRHMQRLAEGCERLGLPVPDATRIEQEACAVVIGMAQSVVRITLTRGVGARGYAPPRTPSPTRIVAAFEMPTLDPVGSRDGVRMRICDLRLGEQPRLAGIKHLNRLEQVLARAEWDDPAIAEGLLLDTCGRVVSATMANVFAVIGGQLVTPSLQRCGVAGVARADVLAWCPDARICDITLAELVCASEVFLSSSVRGILPVQAVGDNVLTPGVVTRALQQHWRALGFPMEQA